MVAKVAGCEGFLIDGFPLDLEEGSLYLLPRRPARTMMAPLCYAAVTCPCISGTVSAAASGGSAVSFSFKTSEKAT